MRISVLNRLQVMFVLALIVTATLCRTALAAETTLMCEPDVGNDSTPVIVTFDEAERWARLHILTKPRPMDLGPLDAKFDQYKITWVEEFGGIPLSEDSINRASGVYTVIDKSTDTEKTYTYTCRPGKSQF